jgi:hypothetical protein
MSKRTSYSKIYRSDDCTHQRSTLSCVLTRGRNFTVRADNKKNLSTRTRLCIRADTSASGRRADVTMRSRRHRRVCFTSLPLALPPTPSLALRGRADASARIQCGRSKKINYLFIYFFGSYRLEKRGKKCSVFNP